MTLTDRVIPGRLRPEDEILRVHEALDHIAGLDGRLAQVLKEDGWNILGYIDKHCEGWMSLLESGADQTPDVNLRTAKLDSLAPASRSPFT